jgi:hypothetical protein
MTAETLYGNGGNGNPLGRDKPAMREWDSQARLELGFGKVFESRWTSLVSVGQYSGHRCDVVGKGYGILLMR